MTTGTLITLVTLIIFGIFILAAFAGGFFLGYYKREGKIPDPPEHLLQPFTQPIIRPLKEIINAVKARQERPPKLSRAEEWEQERANEFFN